MRGIANIAFLGVDCVALFILLAGNVRRQVIYLMGLALGDIMMTRFYPYQYAKEDTWKFGYATGVITLVLLLSCYFYRRRQYMAVAALILAIVAVNLLLNYRSPVLTLLVALALTVPVIPERLGRLRLLPRAGTGARLAVLVTLMAIAGLTAEGFVSLATRAGWLGEDAQKKNELESQSSAGWLGGRAEIIIGLRAAIDSPILGHGSWAQDFTYIDMLYEWQHENGFIGDRETAEVMGTGRIPSHSHLVGAWVDGGILGAVCWGYIFWLNLRAIMRLGVTDISLVPIYAAVLVNFAWTILFSPLGTTARMGDALALMIVLDILRRKPDPSNARIVQRLRAGNSKSAMARIASGRAGG